MNKQSTIINLKAIINNQSRRGYESGGVEEENEGICSWMCQTRRCLAQNGTWKTHRKSTGPVRDIRCL
jgi:hypothetical protein